MNKLDCNVLCLPDEITIGRRTETGVLEVRIDCTGWLAFWPKLSMSAWVTPPHSSAAYPAATRMDGKVLVWSVSNADTAVEGTGTLEVVGVAPGQKKLSAATKTRILHTTTDTTTKPPEAEQAWVDKVARDAQRAEQAADRAEHAADTVDWANVDNKPTTFPPSTHTHNTDQINRFTEQAAAAAPVQSVNGKTGGVVLEAADVGALPDNYTPPVTSVNGKTGDVTVDMLAAYPVGSIYMSVAETSPASLFGGTWEILNDVFLLAAGSYANAGTFGGEAVHTLTTNEIPSHTHNINAGYANIGSASSVNGKLLAGDDNNGWLWDFASTGSTGGGEAHNNMPPYLAVYMWKRVA